MNKPTNPKSNKSNLPTVNGRPISADGIVQPGRFGRPAREPEAPCLVEVNAAHSLMGAYRDAHPCKWTCSYKIKHLIERRLGQYVSNGAAIIAANLSGFAQRFDRGPNTEINVPVELLRELGHHTQRKPKPKTEPPTSSQTSQLRSQSAEV